jgi:hypothetical protein
VAKRASSPAIPPYKRAGFSTEYAYKKARSQARKWSNIHSKQLVSLYDPLGTHRDPKAFRAYYDAFVSNTRSSRARKARNLKTSGPALKKYMIQYGNFLGGMEAYEHDPEYA